MAFTFFFRDQDCLDLAVRHLIPQVTGRSKIRIWDAGCATGPEAYTLAIMMAEKMGTFGFRNLEIHATDNDKPLLQTVSEGIYRYEDLKRVPDDFFNKYFVQVAGNEQRFQVVDRLRSIMRVHLHDLLSLKPIRDNFSLVVCKNVLLHFQYPERIEVLEMFYRALEPGGLLVMEHTQKMPQEAKHLFDPVVLDGQLFRRREEATASPEAGSKKFMQIADSRI